MVQVEVDAARNALSVHYTEHVGLAEMKQGRQRLAVALEQMQPGFRLLTDLSGLDSMEYACAPEIEAAMDMCRKKGVGLVVRVVPDVKKDIGFKVMSYFHYGRKVPVLTFEDRTEALARFRAP